MSDDPRDRIRQLLLERLSSGRPVARAELLRDVARHLGESPGKRKLRMDVSRALRSLEEDGRLVDAGPEVYLNDGTGPGAGGA